MVRNSDRLSIAVSEISWGVEASTGEVNGAVVVGVNLVDHVLQFRLGGVLAQGAHDGAKLLGGDLSWGGALGFHCALEVRSAITHHRHPCPISRKTAGQRSRHLSDTWGYSQTGRRLPCTRTLALRSGNQPSGGQKGGSRQGDQQRCWTDRRHTMVNVDGGECN